MMSNKKWNHVQNKINNLNSKQTLHNISYFYAKLLCSNQNLNLITQILSNKFMQIL
jgi:hypothetical protein